MLMHIVWIEDELALLQECADYLRRESIEVTGAAEFEEARAVIERSRPDLLLVDWTLPGEMNGIDICKYNLKHWQLPLIMVTARGDEFDKVLALELGADDYLTKPFGLRELSARIKAVMRRASQAGRSNNPGIREEKTLRRSGLVMDMDRFLVQRDGEKLELTRTEFLLLWKLASYPGRVFTRAHLMDEALGDSYLGYERTLDSHIRNLRRKLGDHESESPFVQTVYGVGYRFAEGN
ncbi:DNA-binding response regulator [Paenibacillus sp. 1011MAR3C5]|nr:DNA-binding response regulator [Paenibacillus sp. 1011MAR3C5]